MSTTLWIVIFTLLVLKIPVAWVCWVVWWAIKAEPIVGADGEPVQELNWKPWRRPQGPRPRRGGPHGGPARDARAARRQPAASRDS